MSVKDRVIYVYTGKIQETRGTDYVCVKCHRKVKAQTADPSYSLTSDKCPVGGVHRWKKV